MARPFAIRERGGLGDRSSAAGHESADPALERDADSSLAPTRKGRFAAVDPSMLSAELSNPKTSIGFAPDPDDPLRHMDTGGLRGADPWDQLTVEEQTILAEKLNAAGNKSGLETPRWAFNSLFEELRDEKEIAAAVVAIKNLIDNAGGHTNGEVWKQISHIEGIWIEEGCSEVVGIKIVVKDKNIFLEKLASNGFDVDAAYERLNFHGKHVHSARFITERCHHTSMHFVQQRGYHDNRFDVHWDRFSVAFRKGLFPGSRLAERVAAAAAHIFTRRMTSHEVRMRLKAMGMVPPEEP